MYRVICLIIIHAMLVFVLCIEHVPLEYFHVFSIPLTFKDFTWVEADESQTEMTIKGIVPLRMADTVIGKVCQVDIIRYS